ncbi:MAG: DEAD/DEAH box helicase [Chloroflexota bacterium]|nr:DEAD/DEAH box helicase [Chloroflexota bacterium]
MPSIAPLIVQSDFSILADIHTPEYETVRPQLARFAELERSPEHIHFYRITPLSLWNAAAAGMRVEEILDVLSRYSRFELPSTLVRDVVAYVQRYGQLQLIMQDDRLLLQSADSALLERVCADERCRPFLLERLTSNTALVELGARGALKHALVELGYPPEDLAGYKAGAPLQVDLRTITLKGSAFELRHYQREAIDAFYMDGSLQGGSGVVVLPCGAGKTVVGIGALHTAQTHTLILTPSTIAARQWIGEILDKTALTAADVGEYSSERKELKPVTVATYQILTYRPMAVNQLTGEIGDFPHMRVFNERDWGLLIYDEVHLLPAPVFRATAELQARRRLGLTATLVREDGRERDVFSLIGPKKYDMPWRDLEQGGWIAQAECIEIRVDMDDDRRMAAALAENRQDAYRIAAENPAKLPVLHSLVQRHRQDHVLVIGQYIEQLETVAKRLEAPLLTGKTPTAERERLYAAFRRGTVPLLVVSKIANFAVDLPDADVAIQISGTFGSRQEEAQRLGRILRPKADGRAARFYTMVTRDSRDQEFSAKRQLFLAEQGYRYSIMDAHELV